MRNDYLVISVGGSLIVPDRIDVSFLAGFKKLILSHVKRGKRFIIITGGGRTARNYQDAAKKVNKLDDEDLDWLGIYSTRLNAHLLKTIFGDYASQRIVEDPTENIMFSEKILLAGGWKPGCSTDFDAALLANNFRVKKIINLSNIDYAFDKDPNKFRDAKPLSKISWKAFRRIVGNKWSPGLSAPFDPVASRLCDREKLTVYVLNGRNFKNLDRLLSGKSFVGTTIC